MPQYPGASGLTPAQLKQNQEQFRWFTQQAARRNIHVIVHMYNIHVSRPLAAAQGIGATAGAPTPFLREYTRYALSRFFEEFEKVGLYICPGEALRPKYQLEWFRDVVFDAAKKSGKNPQLILRDWTMDMDFRAQIPSLYANCYSELKHNDESLTSPVPDRRHEQWKGVLKGHVVNLHGPPMDLQPMRWASPDFSHETVSEWKRLGFVKGALIYTLSFWQWPYTLDKLEPQQKGYKPAGRKLLWQDTRFNYLDTFGRYLWRSVRDPQAEKDYWERYYAKMFGSPEAGRAMYQWHVATGPVSPGMQNVTATKFANFWASPMLQNQPVDQILAARNRIDDVPLTLTRMAGGTGASYYSQPVDDYFFNRYKTKYRLPGLAQRVSMPVNQYAEESNAGRTVSDAMTPDKVCELLHDLANEGLDWARRAQAAVADEAAKEELGRYVHR